MCCAAGHLNARFWLWSAEQRPRDGAESRIYDYMRLIARLIFLQIKKIHGVCSKLTDSLVIYNLQGSTHNQKGMSDTWLLLMFLSLPCRINIFLFQKKRNRFTKFQLVVFLFQKKIFNFPRERERDGSIRHIRVYINFYIWHILPSIFHRYSRFIIRRLWCQREKKRKKTLKEELKI
jgi:hypothetical protein